jgi:hypothetical protein
MPRISSSGRRSPVEAATDLGTERDEVPTVQHHDTDLLLYRKVFRPFVRSAELIGLQTLRKSEYVVEKEKPF